LQVLIRNTHLSIDPTHRIWMSDAPQYMPCVEIGGVMRALTAGVVEVRHPTRVIHTICCYLPVRLSFSLDYM
jgi:NADPH-dependent curcumin reductase CurA